MAGFFDNNSIAVKYKSQSSTFFSSAATTATLDSQSNVKYELVNR